MQYRIDLKNLSFQFLINKHDLQNTCDYMDLLKEIAKIFPETVKGHLLTMADVTNNVVS